jgi:hypothetical protein
LPLAYTHPAAARVRKSGGASAKLPHREAIEAYLRAVDIPAALEACGAKRRILRQRKERISRRCGDSEESDGPARSSRCGSGEVSNLINY